MRMPNLVSIRPAHQATSIVLALVLLATGLVSLPFSGQASATGVAAGKYGSEQVFQTTGLVTAATCSVEPDGDPAVTSATVARFSTITVSRTGLVNPVTMTNNRYVSFFETADASNPWGAKLFESNGTELRLSGSDWISAAAAETASVSFDTLRLLSPAGKIYALADEGFVYSGTDVGELLIANGGPLTTSLTITPTAALNDCTSGASVGKLSALQSTYVANSNVNLSIIPAPSGSITLVRSVGNFGKNQSIKPVELKASGSGTFTYSISAGTLPAGMTITTDRMILSGAPSVSGDYNFTLTVQESGTTVASQQYTGFVFDQMVLDNVALRFGNGNEHSVNSVGLFQQPFYKSPVDSNYYQLTFSDYPLDMAVGIGRGATHWTGAVVKDLSSLPPVSQIIDYSNFIIRASDSTTRARGYGVINVTTRFNFDGSTRPFEVSHKYSLGQNDSFVKIDTTVRNLDTATAENTHIWVGTRDDFVGIRDSQRKTRGNLNGPGGSFQAVSSRTATATALRISTATEGALFYSVTPGANTVVNGCCSFSGAYDINPSSTEGLQSRALNLDVDFDGSYAAVLPVGDVSANGGTATITWFYAAGAIGDLDAVARAVAGAASDAPQVTRSGSTASLTWSAPDPGTGRVISGYQYRYYSQLDSSNNPIWVTSAVLPVSPRSASVNGISTLIPTYFQIRTITEASGGGDSAEGDWSTSATLPAVPAWNPASRSIAATVGAEVTASISTNEATGLILTSGATVTVTGLPEGVSATVSGRSTANTFPTVNFSGTATTPGTYTVTVAVTDSAGNVVSVDFTFTVNSPASIGSSTPIPSPTPTPPQLPNPRPSIVPIIPIVPIQIPIPISSPAPALGPINLIPTLEPTPSVVYGSTNPIPQILVDLLSKPLAYVLDQLTEGPLLPKLTPSESLAYENGSPVEIRLVMTDQENGYSLIGDGWQVDLQAADGEGAPLRLDDSGNIILNQDRFVQFSGTGFAPGSIIKVWLFSDPAEVAEVLADASGNFVGQAQLPEGIPTGEHTVQLNGLSKDGQLRSVSLGVVVQPDIVIAPAPPVGFDLTGLMNLLWLLAAGVLVFFFILWRRRKKEEEEQGSAVTGSDDGDLIFASESFAPTPLFPDDSRRKAGPAAPPNRRRFTFKPKNT